MSRQTEQITSKSTSNMSLWFEDIQNAALDQFRTHQKSFQSGFVKVMPCGQVSNILGVEQTFNFSCIADKVKQS